MQAISLVKIGLFPSYICFINKVHPDNPKLPRSCTCYIIREMRI
jgi:hypothetical protein